MYSTRLRSSPPKPESGSGRSGGARRAQRGQVEGDRPALGPARIVSTSPPRPEPGAGEEPARLALRHHQVTRLEHGESPGRPAIGGRGSAGRARVAIARRDRPPMPFMIASSRRRLSAEWRCSSSSRTRTDSGPIGSSAPLRAAARPVEVRLRGLRSSTSPTPAVARSARRPRPAPPGGPPGRCGPR